MAPIDLKANEEKWQARWAADKRYEAEPDSREKFFLNMPYPYMSGLLHISALTRAMISIWTGVRL